MKRTAGAEAAHSRCSATAEKKELCAGHEHQSDAGMGAKPTAGGYDPDRGEEGRGLSAFQLQMTEW